jgi:hypothetical protein
VSADTGREGNCCSHVKMWTCRTRVRSAEAAAVLDPASFVTFALFSEHSIVLSFYVQFFFYSSSEL